MESNHQIYEPGQYVKWYKVWTKTSDVLVLAISREDAEAATVHVTGEPVEEVFLLDGREELSFLRVIITEAARGHNMDLISKICRPHRTEIA